MFTAERSVGAARRKGTHELEAFLRRLWSLIPFKNLQLLMKHDYDPVHSIPHSYTLPI